MMKRNHHATPASLLPPSSLAMPNLKDRTKPSCSPVGSLSFRSGLAHKTVATLFLVFLCCGYLSASVLYNYDIIAQTGQNNLTGLAQPSINDTGEVVFVGTTSAGQGLYVGDGSGNAININPGSLGGGMIFTSPQINNAGFVVARDRVNGAPATFFVRIWNSNSIDDYTPIAKGGVRNSICAGGIRAGEVCINSIPDCPIIPPIGPVTYADCVPIGPPIEFSSLINPRMNNNNQIVFIALTPDSSQVLLVTPSSGGEFNEFFLGGSVSGVAPISPTMARSCCRRGCRRPVAGAYQVIRLRLIAPCGYCRLEHGIHDTR